MPPSLQTMASAAATAAAQGDEDAAASSAAIASAIDPPADGNEVVVPDPVQLFAPDYEGSHGRVATIVPSPVRASKAQRTVAGRSTTAHAKKPVTASSPRRKKRGSIAPPSPSRGRMTRAAALVHVSSLAAAGGGRAWRPSAAGEGQAGRRTGRRESSGRASSCRRRSNETTIRRT